jgi:hypothetical protein
MKPGRERRMSRPDPISSSLMMMKDPVWIIDFKTPLAPRWELTVVISSRQMLQG